MAEITAAEIRRLREASGAGMSDVKRALTETGGDFDRALTLLREKNLAGVPKRGGRQATNGMVHAYLHRSNSDLPPTVGVLLELNCETDFVAKNEQFSELARELALHVAFTDPPYMTREQVPVEAIEAERKIYESAAREEGKPEAALQRIVDGRVEGYYKEKCLLEQPWVKDGKKTIQTLIDEAGARLGEKVQLSRFVRYKVGAP